MVDSDHPSHDADSPASIERSTVSSVLLSRPAAALEQCPYPTFAELDSPTAASDEDDDVDGDHWLDVALSSPPVRSSNARTSAAPSTSASSALSSLRAAHRSEVDRQRLSDGGWEGVKEQTRQHILLSHNRAPSAASIAALSMEECQPNRTQPQPLTPPAPLTHTATATTASTHTLFTLRVVCRLSRAAATTALIRRAPEPFHCSLSASTACCPYSSLGYRFFR